MGCVIGVDFDNTLVSYDAVMRRVAVQQGLLASAARSGKRQIRDQVRQSVDGERAWQRLQSVVYGARIGEARLIDGVSRFFKRCKRSDIPVVIVSHKTEFAALDETGTNLRSAAMTWMERHGFFAADGLGLSGRDVYFESTRLGKLERIRQLRCTHFIDDLEDTFLEPSFPQHVEKILYYVPSRQRTALPGVRCVGNWQEIYDYFFDSHSRS